MAPKYLKEDEPFALRLIKHPFIWSGAGMIIRYGDDPTKSGQFWKTVGVLSLAVGLGHAIMTHQLPEKSELA